MDRLQIQGPFELDRLDLVTGCGPLLGLLIEGALWERSLRG